MYCRFNGPLRPNWPPRLPITTANPAHAPQPPYPQPTFTRLPPRPPRPPEPRPLYMSLPRGTNKLPSHLPPHRHRLLITRGPFCARRQPPPSRPIRRPPRLPPQPPRFSPGTPKSRPLPPAMPLCAREKLVTFIDFSRFFFVPPQISVLSPPLHIKFCITWAVTLLVPNKYGPRTFGPSQLVPN